MPGLRVGAAGLPTLAMLTGYTDPALLALFLGCALPVARLSVEAGCVELRSVVLE